MCRSQVTGEEVSVISDKHSKASIFLSQNCVPFTVPLFLLHVLLKVIGKEMKWRVRDVREELLWAGGATEGWSHLRAGWNCD